MMVTHSRMRTLHISDVKDMHREPNNKGKAGSKSFSKRSARRSMRRKLAKITL